MTRGLAGWVERLRVVLAPAPLIESATCAQCQRFVPAFAGVRYAEATYCGAECDEAAQADAL